MINEYVLKLQGKVGLLEPLILDHSYQLSIGGQIVKESEESNQNGTSIKSYTFRPVTVEILSDKGQIIKTIDPRRDSVKLRACIWQVWEKSNYTLDFIDFYHDIMGKIMYNIDEIIVDYVNRKV